MSRRPVRGAGLPPVARGLPLACLAGAVLLAGCAALPESVSRDARMAAARQRAAATLAPQDAGSRRAASRAAPAGAAPLSPGASGDAAAPDAGALPADYQDQLREAYRRYLDLPADRYDLRFGRAYRAVRDAGASGPARTGWAVPVVVEEDIGGADGPAGRRRGFAHLSFYDPAARAFEPPVPVWKLPQLRYLYREIR